MTKISDEDVLVAIEAHRSPAVGTTDIGETLPVTRQAVYNRLESLNKDGLVEKYTAGRDVVWYITPAGRRYLDKD